jgi:hypothetical protein
MSANLTKIEREALSHAVSCFAQKLRDAGCGVPIAETYIGRDQDGELFYEIRVQRHNASVVVLRLTLTAPHGS